MAKSKTTENRSNTDQHTHSCRQAAPRTAPQTQEEESARYSKVPQTTDSRPQTADCRQPEAQEAIAQPENHWQQQTMGLHRGERYRHHGIPGCTKVHKEERSGS